MRKTPVFGDPYGNTSGEGAVSLSLAFLRPRAIAPQWGEPMGSLPRTGTKTKIEQTKAKPCNGNQPTPLKGPPRLGFGVNASREPTGPSSARQGRHQQKNEQAQAKPDAGNTSAAKPPRAIAPQWGEPPGSTL